MDKNEFLTQLRAALSSLAAYEVESLLAFYTEMIDDRVEEGASEAEAVASLGDVEQIAAQFRAQTPAVPKAIARVKTKSRPLNIVLLIVGAPIWVSLLIAFGTMVVAIYITIWTVLVALWAVVAALLVASIAGVASGLYYLATLHPLTAVFCVGAGLACMGIGIFSYFGVLVASKGLYQLTTRFASRVRSLFVREARHEEVQ
jgi:uncharacterized membrane protein